MAHITRPSDDPNWEWVLVNDGDWEISRVDRPAPVKRPSLIRRLFTAAAAAYWGWRWRRGACTMPVHHYIQSKKGTR